MIEINTKEISDLVEWLSNHNCNLPDPVVRGANISTPRIIQITSLSGPIGCTLKVVCECRKEVEIADLDSW